MQHVLISACLLGAACRYDGKSVRMEGLEELQELCHLIPVCPEIYGGLSTPRIPAERAGKAVINREGQDVTGQYQRGAAAAASFALLFGCRYALLKERSPSCGKGSIYDGSFQGTLTEGDGVTAERLAGMGVQIYGESQLTELLKELKLCGN